MLLELGVSIFEMSITRTWLQNRKAFVEFLVTQPFSSPSNDVVLEELDQLMQDIRNEPQRRIIREMPSTPERFIYTIQSTAFSQFFEQLQIILCITSCQLILDLLNNRKCIRASS